MAASSGHCSVQHIEVLKLLLGNADSLELKREFMPAPGLASGVPKGVIVELLGAARTEWFLEVLKINADFRVFWCEREQRILPTAIQQRGVDLERITFGLLADDLYQPLRRVVQSQLYQVILAPNEFSELRIFKAFQLLTEKTNATLFLLGGKKPSAAWPISLQLDIKRSKNEAAFEVGVIKQKHGRTVPQV